MLFMLAKRHLNTSAKLKSLLIFLLLIFGYLQYKLWIAEGKVQDLWFLEQRIAHLEKENSVLNQRNNGLSAEVDNLKSGMEVVELKARQELGWIGEDETFFQFIYPDNEP